MNTIKKNYETRVVIVGAGGIAREIKYHMKDMYDFVTYATTDSSTDKDYNWLEKNKDKYDGFIIGIGSPKIRLKVANELKDLFPDKFFPNVIHPSVIIDYSTLKIGKGVILAPGVTGTVNITLDDYCLINLGVTIGHEATIGKGCVINPNASISGGVTINDGVLIGTGAQVLQYLSIGSNSTVGAGAAVTKNVENNVTVVGIPAKELKK